MILTLCLVFASQAPSSSNAQRQLMPKTDYFYLYNLSFRRNNKQYKGSSYQFKILRQNLIQTAGARIYSHIIGKSTSEAFFF